jgi:hypothetical protein
MSDNEEKSPFKPFEAALDLSKKLIDWALLILGGSIALLLGTSHAAPTNFWLRLTYALFPLGWIFLALSMNSGVRAQRAYLSLLFRTDPSAPNQSKDEIERARKVLGEDTLQQIRHLKVGLVVFALWLTIYLLAWLAGFEFKPVK